MDGWMDVWLVGWMDGCMDGCMDGWSLITPNSQLFCLCLLDDLLLPIQEVMQLQYVMMLSMVPIGDAAIPILLSDIGTDTRVEVIVDVLGFQHLLCFLEPR